MRATKNILEDEGGADHMHSDIGPSPRNPPFGRMPWIAAAGVLALGLALSVFGARALQADRAERERLHLAQEAATQVRQLELGLQLALESLTSVKAFYDAGGARDERQFELFVRSEAAFHEGTLALGWAPRIREFERTAFEAALSARSGRPETIFEATGHGLRRAVASCTDCFVVQYLTAIEGGDMQPGLNLASLPSRAQAIGRALISGRPSSSKTRRSDVWGRDGDLVVQVFQPVALDGGSVPGEPVAGLAVGVFNVSTLLRRVFFTEPTGAAQVALFDLDAPAVEQRLFTFGEPDRADRPGDFATARLQSPQALVHDFRVADRRWAALFTSVPAPPNAALLLPLAGLLGGALLTALLSIYLFVALSRGQQVARLGDRLLTQQLAVGLERDLRRQAQATAGARSAFLQAASHDLRQPLHALGLSLGVLAAQPAAAHDRSFVARLQQSVTALHAMFDALLDLGRLESGRLETQLRAFELAPLLERLGAEAALQAERDGLRMIVRIPQELAVASDPLLVERMVRNLLVNALRYTARGWVALRAVQRGGFVEIRVIDSGPGIAKTRRQHVFEPYVRDAHHADGIGLGLAIVQALASHLGHELRVSSRLGRGSVFSLRLPVAPGHQFARSPPPDDESSGVLTGFRILLLDDDSEVLAATAALLRAWGGTVLVAASEGEATGLMVSCAEHGEVVDLLLIDEQLSALLPTGDRSSGSAWLTHWRARGLLSPAVLLSADPTPNLRAAVTACGALLVAKPLTPLRLRSILISVLKSPASFNA